jgi:penicillin-insensitive murein DD-endopeptidase
MNYKKIILLFILLGILGTMSPQIFHKNKGESISKGTYSSGSLENAYLLPKHGENYKCYSTISYYILGREYVHSKLYRTITDAYEELNQKHPGRKFIYMETGKRKGGRPYPHRTHQNGLSIDFMSPLTKNGNPKYYACLGIFRYALNFDENGRNKSNPKVSIDFNLMAEHL